MPTFEDTSGGAPRIPANSPTSLVFWGLCDHVWPMGVKGYTSGLCISEHAETTATAAKTQSSFMETATMASWFETSASGLPPEETLQEVLICVLLMSSLLASHLLSRCLRGRRGALLFQPQNHIARGEHPSLQHVCIFSVYSPNTSLFHVNNKEKKYLKKGKKDPCSL